MKKKLTAAVVERIKPPAKDKAQYFDQGYPGLELAVNYGGSKTWWLHSASPAARSSAISSSVKIQQWASPTPA